jgi:dihydrofolate reductase
MRAIAAMASNRVIGKDGKLPWHIKGDLKFFKKMTDGCICVVGRKTFDDLPYLPNRRFVVESRQVGRYELGKDPKVGNEICGVNLDWEGRYLPVYSGRDDVWVIGGASIFKALLPYCTDLYLTRIFKSYEGDTFFPSFEHLFIEKEVVERTDEYAIVHYVRRSENQA